MDLLNEVKYREGDTRFILEDEQPIPGMSAQGLSESFPLDSTRSLYGTTKLCSELLIAEYLEMYNLHGSHQSLRRDCRSLADG